MISLIASAVSKTVATIEKVTNVGLTAGYNARTVATEIVQTSKLKVEFLAGEFYRLLKKVFAETVNLSEKLNLIFGKRLSENVDLSDTVDKGVGKNLNLDVGAAADSLEKTVTYNRNLIDNTAVEDIKIVSLEKPVVSTTLNLSDEFSKSVSYNKSITNEIFVTDDLNGAGVDDDQIITFFKVLNSEILQVKDDLVTTINFARSFDNFGEVSETINIQFLKDVKNNVNLTDQVSKTVEYNKSFNNIGQVFDSHGYSFIKAPILEDLNVTDKSDLGFNKNSIDTVNITEKSVFNIEKSLKDLVNFTDDQNIILLKTLPTQTVQIVDSIIIGFNQFKVFLDNTNISDLPKITFDKVKLNEVDLTDSLFKSMSFNRIFNNSTEVNDLLKNYFNKPVDVQNIEISDQFILLFNHVRNFVDSNNQVTDLVGLTPTKSQLDLIQLTDTISSLIDFNRTLINNANLTDQLSNIFNKTVSEENMQLQETIFIESGLVKSDVTELIDILNYSLNKVPTEEQIQILSLAQKSTDKIESNSVQLTSSGILLNQNYVGTADYFKEDYVGASRSFT